MGPGRRNIDARNAAGVDRRSGVAAADRRRSLVTRAGSRIGAWKNQRRGSAARTNSRRAPDRPVRKKGDSEGWFEEDREKTVESRKKTRKRSEEYRQSGAESAQGPAQASAQAPHGVGG